MTPGVPPPARRSLMSKLRPTLTTRLTLTIGYCPSGGTLYLLIYRSIIGKGGGLLHGKLRNHRGQACSVGRYFNDHPGTTLPTRVVDEVASVNDSMPTKTMAQRKRAMLRWLRWRMGKEGLRP